MSKLFGDKAFYKKVLAIALPIMLQNGIANVVGMLDNVMVGRLGTEQMSGVSIVNQLTFIYFLCLFGAIGGAGIFTAQFYGQKNEQGIRDTFRFKLIVGAVIVAVATIIFLTLDSNLISLYLHEGSADGDLAATLHYGEQYLAVVLVSLVFSMIENCYSSTLRECGQTVVPMIAVIASVVINVTLNYILIYGKVGMPALGVVGAAVATVISRFIQVLIVVIWAHTHPDKAPYFKGALSSFRVPVDLAKKILVMATPLIFNETLWAAGIAVQTQIYSSRGLSVVAALNINSSICNVFNIAFIALGDAVAILVGQLLGAGKFEEGRSTAYKIITFSTLLCVGVGGILFLVAPLFPAIFNTSDEVKQMATNLIRVSAITMPIGGYLHSTYFTIRSGGKTVITFLFDSVFLWVIAVPAGFVLTHWSPLNIVMIYLLVCLLDLIKCVIGTFIVKSGVWAQNIVDKAENS